MKNLLVFYLISLSLTSLTYERILAQPLSGTVKKPSAAGKWSLKDAKMEITLTVAADGAAVYEQTLDGKTVQAKGTFKDGVLSVEFDDKKVVKYAAKFRDVSLVLTEDKADAKGPEIVLGRKAEAKDVDGTKPATGTPDPKVPEKKKFVPPTMRLIKPTWDVSAMEERYTILKSEYNEDKWELHFLVELTKDTERNPEYFFKFYDKDDAKLFYRRIEFVPPYGTKKSEKVRAMVRLNTWQFATYFKNAVKVVVDQDE